MTNPNDDRVQEQRDEERGIFTDAVTAWLTAKGREDLVKRVKEDVMGGSEEEWEYFHKRDLGVDKQPTVEDLIEVLIDEIGLVKLSVEMTTETLTKVADCPCRACVGGKPQFCIDSPEARRFMAGEDV